MISYAIACIHAPAPAEDEASLEHEYRLWQRSGGGLLGWLDPRSAYNQEFFPQPLLVEDTSWKKKANWSLLPCTRRRTPGAATPSPRKSKKALAC